MLSGAFETAASYVAQVGSELAILLLQPPVCYFNFSYFFFIVRVDVLPA